MHVIGTMTDLTQTRTIANAMLPLLCDRLEVTADRVTHAAAHRWRYCRVTQALD